MLVKKLDARRVQNSPACTVWEYEIPSENISFATAYIDGRYPENGRVINQECEEIYFVRGGSGIIHSDKGNFEINPGDMYHFEKNERFWVMGKQLSIDLMNSPKWTPEQHKNVD